MSKLTETTSQPIFSICIFQKIQESLHSVTNVKLKPTVINTLIALIKTKLGMGALGQRELFPNQTQVKTERANSVLTMSRFKRIPCNLGYGV